MPTKDTKKDFSDVISSLKSHIPPGGKVILALSGGADSVFLFNFCLRIKKQHPFKLIVTHVNHGLRGKESDNDASFAQKLAEKNACGFELHKIKTKPKGNIEEQFRKIRYDFLEKTRKKHKADLILTAHHLNDNIETVLLNLTRGCHLDGLKGMDVFDPRRLLLRPLLTVPKKTILEHLKRNRVAFCTDSTNLDTQYSRNLIRHKVIPELKKINKNLEKTFLQNLKNFRSAGERNEKIIGGWINANSDNHGLKIKPFLILDGATQKDVIFRFYKDGYGNLNGLSQSHVGQIIGIIHKNRTGLKKEFGPRFILAIAKPENATDKYIQILKKTTKQVI